MGHGAAAGLLARHLDEVKSHGILQHRPGGLVASGGVHDGLPPPVVQQQIRRVGAVDGFTGTPSESSHPDEMKEVVR
ncbi:hypothetical protein [Streptomyces sp. XH2]|uniref:hypothetical protein n=1 Tax=Streptomyces sp. XH2 TaxID=3412483 RepID=UPI003C7A92EA